MKAYKRWTPQEVERMLSLLPEDKIREVAAALGREKRSVDSKIRELRRSGVEVITRPGGKCKPGFKKIDKPWSGEEVSRLLSLVRTRSIRETAALLGRGSAPVSAKVCDLRRHGIDVVTRGRGGSSHEVPFTPEAREWLKGAVASGKRTKEMAEHLGIGQGAVYDRLVKLGINRRRCPHWTAEENEKLRVMAGKAKGRDIAAALGKSFHSVRSHATSMGVSLKTRTSKADAAPRAQRPKRDLQNVQNIQIAKKVQRRTAPAPIARERGNLTPPERRAQQYHVASVNWCSHCNAPYVDTLDGRRGHRERLGHAPVRRAA